jgi:hypothetical protein
VNERSFAADSIAGAGEAEVLEAIGVAEVLEAIEIICRDECALQFLWEQVPQAQLQVHGK